MLERRLRIMMLAPTPFFTDCGSHVRIYEEAKALVRRGHTVRIVSYHLGRNMPGVQIDRIQDVFWVKSLSITPSWYKFCLDILLFRRALKLAQSFRPHLIHAHLHEGAWIGERLKKKLNIPLLFDCRGSMTGEMTDNNFISDGSLLHRFFAWKEQRINSGASDFIITSSGTMAQQLTDQWGVAKDKVKALVDGVDTTVFRPHQREEVRSRLRLSSDVPLVVYIGTLNHNQGIDTLLAAIVQLKSQESPIRFLIIGFPDQAYRAKAISLGIEGMIIFTGKIEYVKASAYLSAGDIAVSPKLSLTDSNGKLFAYMACGLPAVVFDTVVNRELLGEAGVYVNYNDASDLADKMTLLMGNRDERCRLGALVREQAEKRHNWDILGMTLDEIYRFELKR